MFVMNNPRLISQQKQQVVNNLEEASRNADWLYDMMKQCDILSKVIRKSNKEVK